jgi:hypothetical protein
MNSMNMLNYQSLHMTRMVNIVTPNCEVFSVGLSGNEGELKDLLSTLSGIPINEIKGLKDKHNNYFTLSSAINNPHVNQMSSDIYYLLCGRDSLGTGVNFAKSTGQGFYTSNNTQQFYSGNNNLGGFKKLSSDPMFLNPQNQGDVVKTNSQFSFTNPQISKQPKLSQKSFYSPNHGEQRGGHVLQQKILSICNDLFENRMIDNSLYKNLNSLISIEDENVLNIFKFYISGTIDINSLLISLKKIIQKMQSYDGDGDYSNFYQSKGFGEQGDFQRKEVFSPKNLKVENQNNILANISNFNDDPLPSSNKQATHPITSSPSIVVSSPIISNNEYGRRESSDTSATKTPKHKLQQSQSLDKQVEKNILQGLHTEQKIIFRFALKKKLSEIEILKNFHDTFDNEEMLLKSVKIFCKKFIEENVIKSFSEKEKDMFNSFISKRNQELIQAFKNFNEHYKLSTLQKEVENHIRRNMKNGEVSHSDVSQSIMDEESIEKGEKEKKSKISSHNNQDNVPSSNPNISLERNNSNQNSQNNQQKLNRKVEEFIKLINIANFLKPEEKKQLETMIKGHNKSVSDIIEEYFTTKNITSIKTQIIKLLRGKKTSNKASFMISNSGSMDSKGGRGNIEKKESKSSNTISSTSSPTNKGAGGQGNMAPVYPSFEKLLYDLEKKGNISQHQHRYIIQRFINNDDILLSAWEVYTHNHNLAELIESIKIFANAKRPQPQQVPVNTKTPAALAKSKKEIMVFLKDREKEKDEIKLKQLNIIEILAKENMLDKKATPLINDMIYKENHLLISAFEIFSVSKDHWEFTETLSLIAEIYSNNSKKTNNIPQGDLNDSKDLKLLQIFEEALETANFTEEQKDKLRKKLLEKDNFLMSTLELYENYKDEDDLMDNLQMLVK